METSTAGRPADADLVARIVARDQQALGLLYDRYARLVFAIALRIAQDHSVAEEVVQDVFHAVWQSAGTFEAGRSLPSWLMGIARHRAIDATRSRQYRASRREQALLDAAAPGHEPTDALLLRAVLRDALGALPSVQRQPLALAFFGGLSYPEIADRLGEPVGTVKSRARLGMQKLRAILSGLSAAE